MKTPVETPSHLPPDVRARLAAGYRTAVPMAAGGHIVWHMWGKPRADMPPLVLFHGGSGSWTHWVRNILPLLDAGRTIWAADLPGFGDSDQPATGGDADAMLTPLAESMGQLFGGQPVDLVGFSFGGMTAGLLLAEHPALARRLILVGAPAMGVASVQQLELKAWRHLKTPQEQAVMHRHNLGVLMLHNHRLIDGLALQVHAANVPRDRLPRRRLARTDILARHLPHVKCPVYAIYGEHDALYHACIRQLEPAFAAAAPDFRGMQLIEGAGHWVQFEAPEAFHAALLHALNDDI